MNAPIQLVSAFASRESMTLADAKRWFGKTDQAKNALRRLEREGLVFRIARGVYAVPERHHMVDALSVARPRDRQAVWLQPWLRRQSSRRRLPAGLVWDEARFLALAVDRYTDLVWTGPVLLVPILEGQERVGRVHHTVSVFLYDPVDEATTLQVNGHAVAVPPRGEVARILAVHGNPRLQEAAASMALTPSERDRLRTLVSRTSAPAPFPDPKVRLPRGPPFRYRLLAPMSWVLENGRSGKVLSAREDVGRS